VVVSRAVAVAVFSTEPLRLLAAIFSLSERFAVPPGRMSWSLQHSWPLIIRPPSSLTIVVPVGSWSQTRGCWAIPPPTFLISRVYLTTPPFLTLVLFGVFVSFSLGNSTLVPIVETLLPGSGS
jgi:hypothetical protein